MTKILKLNRLTSYISPATRGEVVQRGNCCKFSDDMADRLLAMEQGDRENEMHPVWSEQPKGTGVTYDFSNREDEADGVPDTKATEPPEDDETDDTPTKEAPKAHPKATPAAKRAVQRKRA